MIEVIHFQRKQRPEGNFSLEFIFEDVRHQLQDKVKFTVVRAKNFSNGIWPRIQNALVAKKSQGAVNHITGDVHYLNLFFDKRNCILTVLDCGFMGHPNPIAKAFYKTFWLTLPERRSRFITAISEATRQQIIGYTKCDPAKVFVIPVAVSSMYQPSPKSFNVVKPRLLQIGTAPNKNIPRLIEAIRGIPCTLVIVGRINSDITDSLNKHKIDFVNRINISDEELLKEYTDCDIVTFISTFEGFGMPIIEANCVERVVITGNLTSMPEVAGDAACIVDPFSVTAMREGIEKIISNEDYRNDLIEKGKSNRGRFQSKNIAAMYYDLYKKVYEQN